jgi:TrmH family RNA methyltransferase
MLLEDVQDPGNLGAILRTAAAAGVSHALLSSGCADVWSPRVLRGAMGAHHLLAISEKVDLLEYARRFQGKVVAADAAAGTPIFDLDLRGPLALALGNEGAGLSVSLRKAAHALASVPMAGGLESLNVGAAAAICLFERVRQRRGS